MKPISYFSSIFKKSPFLTNSSPPQFIEWEWRKSKGKGEIGHKGEQGGTTDFSFEMSPTFNQADICPHSSISHPTTTLHPWDSSKTTQQASCFYSCDRRPAVLGSTPAKVVFRIYEYVLPCHHSYFTQPPHPSSFPFQTHSQGLKQQLSVYPWDHCRGFMRPNCFHNWQ